MHLYRFFNPLVYGADRWVIIESANAWGALHAYVVRYHNGSYMVRVSKDIHRDNAIIMEASVDKLDDGVVIFSKIFTIDIN